MVKEPWHVVWISIPRSGWDFFFSFLHYLMISLINCNLVSIILEMNFFSIWWALMVTIQSRFPFQFQMSICECCNGAWNWSDSHLIVDLFGWNYGSWKKKRKKRKKKSSAFKWSDAHYAQLDMRCMPLRPCRDKPNWSTELVNSKLFPNKRITRKIQAKALLFFFFFGFWLCLRVQLKHVQIVFFLFIFLMESESMIGDGFLVF